MPASPNPILVSLTAALSTLGPRLQVTRSALEVPATRRASRTHRWFDAVLDLASGRRLVVEAIGDGYPRDVRAAALALKEMMAAGGLDEGEPPIAVIAARHMTEGARALLKEDGFGYFDATSGSLYLAQGDLLIDVDRPYKAPPKRGRPVSVFRGAREQVVLAALQQPSWFTGDQLAQASGTSTFTASTTLAELDRREWLEARGTGNTLERRLSQPGSLLEAWAQAWREREQSGKHAVGRYYRYGQTHKLMAWLAEELSGLEMPGAGRPIEWAFTGPCAANLLAPHLTSIDSLDLILPPGTMPHVAAALGIEEVDEGHNLRILERSGAALMFREPSPSRELRGAKLANRYIQYLDLLDGRGRNKELAHHLRATLLRV